MATESLVPVRALKSSIADRGGQVGTLATSSSDSSSSSDISITEDDILGAGEGAIIHRRGRGLAWLGLAWLGLAWLGLAWLGLAWLGLAWLGLAWLGLAWLGLAWLGWGSLTELRLKASTPTRTPEPRKTEKVHTNASTAHLETREQAVEVPGPGARGTYDPGLQQLWGYTSCGRLSNLLRQILFLSGVHRAVRILGEGAYFVA